MGNLGLTEVVSRVQDPSQERVRSLILIFSFFYVFLFSLCVCMCIYVYEYGVWMWVPAHILGKTRNVLIYHSVLFPGYGVSH